ncbi:MAG: LysR family transcriptional regulator [Lachnospiraceae bacterium]|nr:LysR family transcriptional regulator [Lachnospiraceae bacterium]
MNIDNLKCFILVAENLSFARAAEALYISQPAVTKQINALENELGVTLFIRSTRHVELTPIGMSFYKDAKDIVMKSQMAVSRIRQQNKNTDFIRIGLSNPVALFYLTPYLTKFHINYPDIRPNIQIPGYKSALNLFLENKLDILFYFKENMPQNKGICFIELEQDTLSCLVPASHPFAEKESVSLDDLSDESIIACNPLNAPLSTSSFQQKLLEQHSAQNILYCDSIEVAHCMVASGIGMAILPGILSLKSQDFTTVPLTEKIPLSYGAFYYKKNTNTALNKFIKSL